MVHLADNSSTTNLEMEKMDSSKKLKEYLSYFLLVVVYLLCSMRYFPGRWLDTSLATITHIASMGPYTLGATIITVSILHKMSAERLPWKNIIRIFLAVSIFLELFLGIANYVDPKKNAVLLTSFIG